MPESKKRQGSILAVMDLSGVGRCSALAVVPVLSLSGCSCALLPTAFFSTHTGGFGAVHRRDLSGDMEPVLDHFVSLGLRFDAVYIGYVASAAQLALMEEALPRLLAPGGRLFVDPVMGDSGKRYTFCGDELLSGFRSLCAKADVIFPNRTEAALLLGQALVPGLEPPAPDAAGLRAIGARHVMVTGVTRGEGEIGVLAVPEKGEPYTAYRKRYPQKYPGTGDLLAASFIAAFMKGASLVQSCGIACDFLDAALAMTRRFDAPPRFGLAFEPVLPVLSNMLAGIPNSMNRDK